MLTAVPANIPAFPLCCLGENGTYRAALRLVLSRMETEGPARSKASISAAKLTTKLKIF